MNPGCWLCRHYDQKFRIITTGVRNVSGELAKFIRWDEHRCALKQEDRCPNHCDFDLNQEKLDELNKKYPDLAAVSVKIEGIGKRLLKIIEEREMDNVKWIANIYQKYEVVEAGNPFKKADNLCGERATQIISFFVIAGSAQEAVNKANEWLKASKIEDAYVSDVYRDDILEIQPLIDVINTGKVREMQTITIDEFRKLVAADSVDRMEPYGRFGISLTSQKKQCENLKVGDTVFFLDATYKGLSTDNIPQVDVILTQAKVV